jgi:ABC-2 type transport system ATP-binding protein
MQHKPRLFVFDEPTSGLDPLMQTEFFKIIKEYVENGATCMISTHILSEVKRYCKNVAIMKDGRLKCTSKVSDILIEEPSLDEVFMHFYEG